MSCNAVLYLSVDELLSRGHTTNKCWPTCVCQQCWQTKVCRMFKKLANNVCRLRTCSFFVGQQAANRALWLVGYSKHGGPWNSDQTTLITLPHFTFALSMTAPKQISGAYVFAYEQLQKSLLQQRCRRLLSRPSPPYCCPTFVGQHFVCRVSAALQALRTFR